MNFTVVHLVMKCHTMNPLKNPISAACTGDITFSIVTLEDQNKIRFELRGVQKLPFCDHRAIKITKLLYLALRQKLTECTVQKLDLT